MGHPQGIDSNFFVPGFHQGWLQDEQHSRVILSGSEESPVEAPRFFAAAQHDTAIKRLFSYNDLLEQYVGINDPQGDAPTFYRSQLA